MRYYSAVFAQPISTSLLKLDLETFVRFVAFTAIFVGASISSDPIGKLVQTIWVPAAIVAVISILALVFGTADVDEEKNQPNGRPMHMVVPYNYVLLSLFTVCVSVCIAKIAAASEPQIVFEAFCLTTAAVVGISVFAVTSFRKFKDVDKVSVMAPISTSLGRF